jgi:hypothetical protein
MMQTTGFAFTTPLYLIIHLLTSPTAKPFQSKHSSSTIQMSTSDLAVLPLSITLGYIFPSILMMLPSPSMITPEMGQNLIAIWQFFPIYTVITQYVLSRAHSMLFSYSRTATTNTPYATTSLSTSYLISAGRVYTFLMTFGVLTHLPPLLMTLCPTEFVYSVSPRLASYIASSDTRFSSVYVPHAPLPSWRSSSLADAIHTFLWWDTYVSGFATVTWAIVLVLSASFEQGRNSPETWRSLHGHSTRSRGAIGKVWFGFLVKIVGWTVIAGPFGAVTMLLWERDATAGVKEKVRQ